MNESGKRRVPDNAPLGFISNRWNKYVFDPGGTINRHYYEMAAYTGLKNRIRSDDVAVKGSRNFKNLDEYLISKDEWDKKKEKSTKLAVSLSFEEYLKERKESLHNRLRWVSKNADKLEGVNIGNRIHVDKLEKDTPIDAIALSERLYKMLPRISFLIS